MNYAIFKRKIDDLRKTKQNFCIGKSLLGEDVCCFHVGGFEGKQVLLTGGIHAREYISSLFLIEEINFLSSRSFNGGVYVIPVLNPDGVRLVLDGPEFLKDEKLKKFLIDVNGGRDFSLWKANLNAVDLNVNFDAKWGKGKSNLKFLAKENFIGYYANSEIENRNVINFIEKNKIDANISFHSKGEVIYYGFNKEKESFQLEKLLVSEVSKINEYLPVVTKDSTGGLSDWVSEKFGIPSMTIELAPDWLKHPITENFLPEILKKNQFVPLKVLEILQG